MCLKTCAVTYAVLLLCGLHAIAQVPEAKKGKSFEIKDSYGTVVLNNESPTRFIEGIKLTMPKEVAEKADVIGLSVTDGSMMWPIRQKQNLRD